MPELLTYVMALIPLVIAGVLIWVYLRSTQGASTAEKKESKAAYQGVVKKDWVATGRIDFATQEGSGSGDPVQPAEFRLLVEERRIVESIAGNENLEIQWRLASLKEAKVVIAHYHKFVADNKLIKSVSEEGAGAQVAAPAVQAAPAAAPPAEAASVSATEPAERVVTTS